MMARDVRFKLTFKFHARKHLTSSRLNPGQIREVGYLALLHAFKAFTTKLLFFAHLKTPIIHNLIHNRSANYLRSYR